MPTKTPQKFYSISRRFSLALVSVVILALFIFAAITIALDISRINADLDRKLENTMQLAETSLVQPLWNFDHSTIANFVEALFLDDTVVYAHIFEGNQVFAEKRIRQVTHSNPLPVDGLTDLPSDLAEIALKILKTPPIGQLVSLYNAPPHRKPHS